MSQQNIDKVDYTFWENLLQEIPTEMFIGILREFQTTLMQSIDDLKQLRNQRLDSKFKSLCHRLKGTSSSIGLFSLQTYFAEIEKLGIQANLNEIDSVYEKIAHRLNTEIESLNTRDIKPGKKASS